MGHETRPTNAAPFKGLGKHQAGGSLLDEWTGLVSLKPAIHNDYRRPFWQQSQLRFSKDCCWDLHSQPAAATSRELVNLGSE